MLCPVCKNVDLVMTDSQGVKIESCPACRGVWLNRCELDKLIERSVQIVSGTPARAAHGQQHTREHDSHHGFTDWGFGRKDHDRGQHGQQGQRKSVWRDVFD